MVKLAAVSGLLLCVFFAGLGGSHIQKKQSKENLEKCGKGSNMKGVKGSNF